MTYRVLHDRYGVLQELGKRAGRETLLARDWQTNNFVVIKLLKFSSELEWDEFKLFEREAQTLKNLSHPAIPEYLDYFEFEVPQYKGFALVQTYIDAKSLEQHRQDGRTFSEYEIKQLAELLLVILSYLHDRYPPVIHRDIKPSNILLSDRTAHHIGRVYLVDFGAVQNVVATEGSTFTVVGTYGYMPPEQFGGRAVPASDLYSLGATLIYLLTGRHPADLPQNNLRIQFEKFVSLNPPLNSWLMQMIEPSLDRRMTSAGYALTVLKQSTNNLETICRSNLLNFEIKNKPVGSKVEVINNKHDLEIIIPPINFIQNICKNSVSKGLLFYFLSFLFLRYCEPFFLFVLGINIWVIRLIILNSLGILKLRITQTGIDLSQEFYDLKFSRYRSESREQITAINLIDTSYQKEIKRDRVGFAPRKIQIWAGMTKFELGSGRLTERELCWLAQELSRWLDLPITMK